MNFDDFDLEIQCEEYYSKDEDWQEINKILAEEELLNTFMN